MQYNMEGNFAKSLRDLDNSFDSVDGATAQGHGCDSTSTAGLPPPASQNHFSISTSHMSAAQQVGCSWPLAVNDISNYGLSPPQINTGIPRDIQELFPELPYGVNRGDIIWNSAGRNDVDGDLMNTSIQAPKR